MQSARGRHGVLLLSEFTGAAVELKDAVLCNPFDVDGLSGLLEQTLTFPTPARRRAMAAMSRRVTTHDVHRWVDEQLSDIGAAGLSQPPCACHATPGGRTRRAAPTLLPPYAGSSADSTVRPSSSMTTKPVAAERSNADCMLHFSFAWPVPRNSPAGSRAPSAERNAAR